MIIRTLWPIIWVALVICLNSCVTDSLMPAERKGYVKLEIGLASLAELDAKLKERTPEHIQNLVITIQDHEGKGTDYTLRTLELLNFQGSWLIERMDLPTGTYQITTLHLTDTTGNIRYAVPEQDAPLAQYVRQALPFSIHVESDSEQEIQMEVMSTEQFSPTDFGFDPALVHFKESFFFFVSLVKAKVDEFMEFLPGEITVSSDGYSDEQSLESGIQKVIVQKGFDSYSIKIESDQYATYEHVFSYDSLLFYRNSPLIIEFQRYTGVECVGGSHVGDVLLLTQEDVNDFGKKCYAHIEGSLQIGELGFSPVLPITDLSPLETLREVSGDLRIISNPTLNSLMGLQYLEKAENVRLESNESLPSFHGLRRLRSMHSFSSINNPSLTDARGLPWHEVVLKDLHIQENRMLQNLQGIEELSGATYITIRNNPKLTDISLPNIRELSFLTIDDNKALVSLRGFNHSIRSLWNLRISNNPLLENLQGILAPDAAAIYGTVIIRKNASLISLDGMRFNETVVRLIIDGNPSLEDISLLSDTRQIHIYLDILNNDRLESLKGLENLVSVGNPDLSLGRPDLTIWNNKSLTDFCALNDLFENADVFEWEFEKNAFNPTSNDFIEGNCAL